MIKIVSVMLMMVDMMIMTMDTMMMDDDDDYKDDLAGNPFPPPDWSSHTSQKGGWS